MIRSKRFLTVALLLLLAGAAAGYFFYRTATLESMLVHAETDRADQSARLDRYRRVTEADSLLYEGDYPAARTAYTDLLADTAFSDLARILRPRLGHVEELLRFGDRLDALRQMASRKSYTSQNVAALEPNTVQRMPLEASRPDQYDSLQFALQKADMRIRNLEGRLRGNSGGSYLNFASRQGNQVYYVGEVRGGKANGRGVAVLSSGSRYRGQWQDNLKHGTGEFHWPDGAYYEGDYEQDERSGEGAYYFPDGSVFVGDWQGDVRQGEGVFYDKDGEVVAQGRWDKDELVD